MESLRESLPTVIQYYKATENTLTDAAASVSKGSDDQENRGETVIQISGENLLTEQKESSETENKTDKTEISLDAEAAKDLQLLEFKREIEESEIFINEILKTEDIKTDIKDETPVVAKEEQKLETGEKVEDLKSEEPIPEKIPKKRGRKRKYPLPSESETCNDSMSSSVLSEGQAQEETIETEPEEEDEIEVRPRKRGRCKKNPDIIPPHLSSDIVLGYKILLKLLETPQFSVFHKPMPASDSQESQITSLNQIKKKFDENAYSRIAEFVNDVREMLTNIYESRNTTTTKRALRLEQILEQRIAQLPNYLRPQCALVLSPDELNNSQNKIRINKGGGFVSLLLEKAEKRQCEKDKEKRKLLAEERKQLKEEQDKDVQEWEKNVLLKDHEEDIKSMWELPAIGHFIHLCTDILNIGEVAQYEVERMLLMPQCSETLDLIMTALLSNSLVRAKLDRTPPMPYSIWSPLVATRVVSWYRAWHREGRNEQKIFEEIGVEPDFWQVMGPEYNPLDYYSFHELGLFQRVWVLKTLCDVDFVRKKTVYDNIRAQTLDELNPVNLGVDRDGNRYIQLKQFCGPDMRIYRQSANLEGDFSPSELIESLEGFEYREGPITTDKVFKDIWELNEKPEVKVKKKKHKKGKKVRISLKINSEVIEKKNLRQSARNKQKSYVLESSDSDQSDTDLATLKSKLCRSDNRAAKTRYRPFSDKEFISLSVFRLPRDKVKPNPKKNSYVPRKYDDFSSEKCVKLEHKKMKKSEGFEDEAPDPFDPKEAQDIQGDFDKSFHQDDMNEDEDDVESKISSFSLPNANVKDKFTVKNLDNLKMVLKKGPATDEESTLSNADEKPDSKNSENIKTDLLGPAAGTVSNNAYSYDVPERLRPDSRKFYLVVDSVDGLRQLISKFASDENDLEIISRSTKSNKRHSHASSCEVQLIERLQNLLEELEPWEWDLIKSSRSNREKMYKEYMNFINRQSKKPGRTSLGSSDPGEASALTQAYLDRLGGWFSKWRISVNASKSKPTDFVHPNEAYWMKMYEEPPPPAAPANGSAVASTSSNGVVEDSSANVQNTDKTVTKDKEASGVSAPEATTSQSIELEELPPRKRTRVTRLQIKLDDQDDFDDELGEDDTVESSESDDNWELPTSQRKRARKEATPKTPKPRRPPRKARGNILEKIENQTVSTDKSAQSSASEKTRKTLFWGPRSSDPSEDLNWETNRQKILEKHNSPKKVLFKGDEIIDDMIEVENALQNARELDASAKTVITSPKIYISQIPGNKKPYFSQAQLKAMDEKAKQQAKGDDTPVFQSKVSKTYSTSRTSTGKAFAKTPGESSKDINTGINTPGKEIGRLTDANQFGNSNINRISNNSKISGGNHNSIINNNLNEKLHLGQPAKEADTKIVASSFSESISNVQSVITNAAQSSSLQPPSKIIQHLKKQTGHIQSAVQQSEGQVQYQSVSQIQKIQPGTQYIQLQKPMGQVQEIQQGNQIQAKSVVQQVHVQQPMNQITQVQIHPSFLQTNAKDGTLALSNIRVHQPVQIQSPSVIAVQQPVQLQNQTIQIQAPRVATIQQPVHMQAAKIATVQQPVQALQPGEKSSDNELYLTDGTVLIKADNNFVQQFMQKDKVLTLNVNEKLDFKKPLFIVKPKSDGNAPANSNSNANEAEPSSSQQNIIVFNKPAAVQQSGVPTTVTNIVIPTNYLVGDNSSVQPQMESSQNLTVVQPNPTFIIRPKTLLNKVTQPQVIKIIDPQNMSGNQNVILSPGNIKFTNQVIRPTNPSVITNEPSQSTLRFIRPQGVIGSTQSVIHNKISTIQTAKGNINSVVPTPRLEAPKSQPSVITSKIIPASVTSIRINSPGAQPQPVRTVVGTPGPQPVRFTGGNTPGIRLVNRLVKPQKTGVITSAVPTPVTVVATSPRPPALAQSIQLQNVNLQPSLIRTSQNRLQVAPTKIIARGNAPITSPIIIKLDDQDDIQMEEDKLITDPAVPADYLQGEPAVSEANPGWMYVVQTSDANDVILTNEQLEEGNTTTSDHVE